MKYKALFNLSFTRPDGTEWACKAGDTFDPADITLPDLQALVDNHVIEAVGVVQPDITPKKKGVNP